MRGRGSRCGWWRWGGWSRRADSFYANVSRDRAFWKVRSISRFERNLADSFITVRLAIARVLANWLATLSFVAVAPIRPLFLKLGLLRARSPDRITRRLATDRICSEPITVAASALDPLRIAGVATPFKHRCSVRKRQPLQLLCIVTVFRLRWSELRLRDCQLSAIDQPYGVSIPG